jgi:hypothetical protein
VEREASRYLLPKEMHTVAHRDKHTK